MSITKTTKQVKKLDADTANELVMTIVEGYSKWDGSLRDYLALESKCLKLPIPEILRVLIIFSSYFTSEKQSVLLLF